ncbi:glycosyltransferase family protein [Pseudodesulfovibrio tunisiensis]|uniref:glycosyltransferase family protein n=1 Tax=Pseudodesulfovibrio tunisiensis TaxID=463192 RepID=UPI001FB32684|nr:glycosyltransferase [Pseudodesulfovibrio tunisiensis]
MKTVIYCQHVLGVGHFFRTLEIARALAPDEVVLVTGGADVRFTCPANMRHERLPGLMMDETFSRFIPLEPGMNVDDTLNRRKQMLADIMRRERPDVFLVELFPFGRRKFGFELLPMLETIRKGESGPCRVACSLRDILVEKTDQAKFERRVLSVLNPLFDTLLVHADPALVRLEETFPATPDIMIPTHYTGYVTPRPESGSGSSLRRELAVGNMPLIVVSAGGSNVGRDLLLAAVTASRSLAGRRPHRLVVFPGPHAQTEELEALKASARDADWIDIREFSTRFPAWLDAADLSVSLAGYNTVMNLLAANTHGLVLPFARNREQRMRAERLAEHGALTMLEPDELDPDRLARRMEQALDRPTVHHGVNLDGAAHSAALLRSLALKNDFV